MLDTETHRRCRACKGTGRRPAMAPCAACRGQGRVPRGKHVPRTYSPAMRRWLASGTTMRHLPMHARRLEVKHRRRSWVQATTRVPAEAFRAMRDIIRRVT